MEKACAMCGETKPAADFYANGKGSLSPYCKPCFRERQKRYHKERPLRHQAPEGMKRCGLCKETKPVAEFHKASGEFDGLHRHCKKCSYDQHKAYLAKRPGKNAEYSKKWRDENPERFRDLRLKHLYGLPLGDYDRLLAAQGGGCAICSRADPGGRGTNGGNFHVDHCHDTQRIRGLLCHGCNVSIGHFQHSATLLQAAIKYLSEGGSES